jgi:hypothetical protein
MSDQQPASKRSWKVARFPIASVAAAVAMVAAASLGSAASSGISSQWTQQREFTSTTTNNFGAPIALSGDGNTALVGADSTVFMYTRSANAWHLQQKINLPSDVAITALAINSDGTEALVGTSVPNDPSGSAVGAWTWSGTRWITHSTASWGSLYGLTLALSGDGSTALVSGTSCYLSSCLPFLISWHGSSFGNWTQGQVLHGIGGAIAISSDGSTALADSSSTSGFGSVTVLDWNGTAWNQQQVLTDKNAAVDGSSFGTGLSLSSNGSVAFIGGESSAYAPPGKDDGYGAAFLFTRTGTQWTQKQTLTAAADIDGEPTVTAISANGSVAMAAVNGPEDAYGTVYVFSCSTTQCAHVQAIAVKSQPNGYGNGFGTSVSLSSAGTTALIGSGQGADPINAAWVFTSG